MGLAESQRLLARLATDPTLRAQFAADPGGVASEFGLSPAEAADFARLPPRPLDDFARSLVRKRLGEVETLLPLTSLAVGPARFAASFRRHARNPIPRGIKKHRDDAVAFADSLAREGDFPRWQSDLARFEAGGLVAHDPASRWVVLRLGYFPPDLVRTAMGELPAPRPRPSWVVWFRARPGGRSRRIVLARPW